jgi:hypothetical protein
MSANGNKFTRTPDNLSNMMQLPTKDFAVKTLPSYQPQVIFKRSVKEEVPHTEG